VTLALPHHTHEENQLKIELRPDAGFDPPVTHSLRDMPDSASTHENLELLHPADVFSAIFERVVESGAKLATDTLRSLDARGTDGEDAADAALRETLSSFLYATANYLDGCKSIIRCLRADDKDNKRTYTAFRNAIGEYHTHVMTVVNHLKHRHRVIRTLYGAWPGGKMVGFLIEGPMGDGVVGQDPLIHSQPNTAFSLHRHLRYHACHIYLAASALKQVLGLPDAPRPESPAEQRATSRKAKAFLDAVDSVPVHFFPDEPELPFPALRKGKDGTVHLVYPAPVPAGSKRVPAMNLNYTFNSGKASTFNIPYLAKRSYGPGATGG
jgi:hypothetical protein